MEFICRELPFQAIVIRITKLLFERLIREVMTIISFCMSWNVKVQHIQRVERGGILLMDLIYGRGSVLNVRMVDRVLRRVNIVLTEGA
jgi:hypothetical protein